ncbi:MAG: flagellar biosynthetic protein FliO [Opitutae bacterium]
MDQLEELSQIFRVLGFLGVFACLAFFLTKFLNQRDLAKKTAKGKGGIVLCDTRSLGNKQFLVVAEYEKEKFLLGISSGSIELLAKLNQSPMPVNLPVQETVS